MQTLTEQFSATKALGRSQLAHWSKSNLSDFPRRHMVYQHSWPHQKNCFLWAEPKNCTAVEWTVLYQGKKQGRIPRLKGKTQNTDQRVSLATHILLQDTVFLGNANCPTIWLRITWNLVCYGNGFGLGARRGRGCRKESKPRTELAKKNK